MALDHPGQPRIICLVAVTFFFIGCNLPTKDSGSKEPRNALMHVLDAWARGDGASLQNALCKTDQKLLDRIVATLKRVVGMSTPDQASKLQGLSGSQLVLDALGTAPDPTQIDIRVRFAIMRADITEKNSGVILAGWRLQKSGTNYSVCLNKAARVGLLDIEEELRTLEKRLTAHQDGMTLRVD